MRLADWCAARGRGEVKRLSAVTGLSYTTLWRGLRRPVQGKTAEKISAATGGEVTIAELVTESAAPPPPKRPWTRGKAKRAAVAA